MSKENIEIANKDSKYKKPFNKITKFGWVLIIGALAIGGGIGFITGTQVSKSSRSFPPGMNMPSDRMGGGMPSDFDSTMRPNSVQQE